MKIIGLTGKSGSGKSTVCEIFRKFGIPCLDADLVSRMVVEKGSVCLSELAEYFGKDILCADGTLDRKKLGSIAFSDQTKLDALNRITHKYINEYVDGWIQEKKRLGCSAIVIDAPTLFESGENKMCDTTVAVISNDHDRIQRILSRDGISADYAEKRISAQKDDSFFAKQCDHTIYNNAGLSELEEETTAFLRKISLISEE